MRVVPKREPPVSTCKGGFSDNCSPRSRRRETPKNERWPAPPGRSRRSPSSRGYLGWPVNRSLPRSSAPVSTPTRSRSHSASPTCFATCSPKGRSPPPSSPRTRRRSAREAPKRPTGWRTGCSRSSGSCCRSWSSSRCSSQNRSFGRWRSGSMPCRERRTSP